MGSIISAILWFVLGAVCGILGLFALVAYKMHTDKTYRKCLTDPKELEEVADGIEKFFYSKKK